MSYANARSFFDAVRDAAVDAERCRRELEALEHNAYSVGSPSFEARIRGASSGDHLATVVGALVDREAAMHARVESDYRLIDAACALLYGSDGVGDGGLFALVGWRADAIYHHFLALRTWPQVAELLRYHPRYVQDQVAWAFDLMDANGMTATIGGIGAAER